MTPPERNGTVVTGYLKEGEMKRILDGLLAE